MALRVPLTELATQVSQHTTLGPYLTHVPVHQGWSGSAVTTSTVSLPSLLDLSLMKYPCLHQPLRQGRWPRKINLPGTSGIHSARLLQKNSPLGGNTRGSSSVPHITYRNLSAACSWCSSVKKTILTHHRHPQKAGEDISRADSPRIRRYTPRSSHRTPSARRSPAQTSSASPSHMRTAPQGPRRKENQTPF